MSEPSTGDRKEDRDSLIPLYRGDEHPAGVSQQAPPSRMHDQALWRCILPRREECRLLMMRKGGSRVEAGW